MIIKVVMDRKKESGYRFQVGGMPKIPRTLLPKDSKHKRITMKLIVTSFQ